MYKNDEYLKFTTEQMCHYIRTKHKKFVEELPAQLEKWMAKQPVDIDPKEKFEKDEIVQFGNVKCRIPIEGKVFEDNTLKLEIATKIACSLSTGIASAESIADHAWEIAELLIKKAKE